MPLDVVAPERVARPQRRLEVDARAGGEVLQRGAGERLGNGFEGEATVRRGDDGQAAAVDRNRVAFSDPAGGGRRRLDLDSNAISAAFDRGDASDFSDDSGEHAAER